MIEFQPLTVKESLMTYCFCKIVYFCIRFLKVPNISSIGGGGNT